MSIVFQYPVSSQEATLQSIPGYKGYFADKQGNIYSAWIPLSKGSIINLDKIKRLKPSPKRHGYLAVSPVLNGKVKTIYVHQLVMLAFVGGCPAGMEVCHEDGNKSNNALYNLRYDTPTGNRRDGKRTNTGNTGVRNNTTKLTENQVREIRRRIATGERDALIAPDFNVSRSLIYCIRTNKTWEWLS